MQKQNELYLTIRNDWKAWLEENHASAKEIWLVYYKKDSGKSRISYEDAVEEAICFGWIDSIIKRIDEEKFCQKFTPRKENSQWSELNKKRAEKMIEQGRMTESGLKKIKAAMKSGEWEKKSQKLMVMEIPRELKNILDRNKTAKENFEKISPSYKKQMVGWVCAAKRPETRLKRVKEVVNLLKKNQKLAMK